MAGQELVLDPGVRSRLDKIAKLNKFKINPESLSAMQTLLLAEILEELRKLNNK